MDSSCLDEPLPTVEEALREMERRAKEAQVAIARLREAAAVLALVQDRERQA